MLNYLSLSKVTLLLLLSCPMLAVSEETPSWVLGIRNGSEGIKLVSGNKIFYRRIASDVDGDKNLTCEKAVEAAEESLKSEIISEVKIPYTLEIIFYDPKIKDCAATISISSGLMSKLLEISNFKNNEKKLRQELENKLRLSKQEVENKLNQSKQEKASIESKYYELKKIVNDNADLFKKYNSMMSDYDRAKSITQNRFKKAELLAVKGLRVKEFEEMIGEEVKINFNHFTKCYEKENKVYSSNHAGLNVCWTTGDRLSEIVSYCHGKHCYER